MTNTEKIDTFFHKLTEDEKHELVCRSANSQWNWQTNTVILGWSSMKHLEKYQEMLITKYYNK